MRMGDFAKKAMRATGLKALCAAVAGLMLSLGATSAQAAIRIDYAPPPIPSSHVDFTVVNESSATDTPPLYGPPQSPAPLDTLSFSNMSGFSATSTDGVPGIDFIDGLLNATVVAHQGSYITGVDLSEFGDYALGRLLVSAGDASAQATSPGLFVTVKEIDGVPVLRSPINIPLTFGPTGPYTFDGSSALSKSGTWTGDGSSDLRDQHVTKIELNLDNQLMAASQAGTTASITKKGLNIHISTNDVPEPASMAVMGLAGLVTMGRKRRRA
jgi:hypothetical protein